MRRALLLLAVLAAVACGGARSALSGGGPDASGTDAGPAEAGPDATPPPGPPAKASKIDLLFVIDNSPSMGDKQAILALAVPEMVTRLVTPRCIGTNGLPTGVNATADGSCPADSAAEFPPITDLHLGILSSSLGGRGSDQCPDSAPNPVNSALSAHTNDKAHLINRGGVAGDPTIENVPGTLDAPAPDDFLSWFPPVPANSKSPSPPTPAVTKASTLVGDFTTLVEGVHEHGCGFEAQNESWYRFLIQPDPFDSIGRNGNTASLQGVDTTILQQRHDFLRPDSLVAIVVVTDENEEAADPLAIEGQGWAFDNSTFPGSNSGTAPEGTIECRNVDPSNPATTGPNDPKCTSCAFIKTAPNYETECPADPPNGTGGYLDPTNDAINVRFFHQRVRFGVSSGYPTSRYLRGLQRTSVPSVGLAFAGDTDHEHDMIGRYIGDQDGQADCVNPLFAASLPADAAADLCHLQPGPRSPSLVYYVAVAGVPHQLLQQDPNNPDSPQKASLTPGDWTLILGNDPEHYDFRGADFHMIESEDPRTTNGPSGWANASQCGPTASDTCDPINGREWNTQKSDLQFACIFPLANPKDCSLSQYKDACDCAPGALNAGSQLCGLDAQGNRTETQIYGKAYPSVREMIIAHAMGTQGVVSSLCPIHTVPANGDHPPDPLFGYRPAMDAFVTRIAPSIGH